jgi:DNA-binding beta-propeller fold protein YncE
MKVKNMKLKIAMTFFLSFLNLSCSGKLLPTAPYQPDTSSSSRTKPPVSANLFALILAPTLDEMDILDLTDNRIKKTIPTGKSPSELAISPDKSHILVINRLDGTISSYFREDNQRIQFTGTVGSGANPTSVIFNNKGTEAFVSYNDNQRILVLSILNRARPVVKDILVLKDSSPNSNSSPYKLAISSDDNHLFAIDRINGNLFTFKRTNDNFTQENVFKVNNDNEKISLEDLILNDNKLYISDSTNSRIIVYDINLNKVSATISLSSPDIKAAILPLKMDISSKKKLYVINQGASTVAVIDLASNKLLKHILLSTNSISDSSEPTDISVSTDGSIIYVTNGAGRNLSIISGKDDKLLRNIGTTPSSGAIPPLSAIKLI